MKNAFLFIISSLFITSCWWDQKEYHYIPESFKPIYKLNDTLIYQSNMGQKDTFIVNYYDHGYRVSDKRYYYERLEVDFKAINKIKFPLDHIGGVSIETHFLEIGWFGANFEINSIDNKGYKNEIINGKTFSNVYHLLPSLPYDYTDSITGIYYSSQYCIVKYETKSGITWELINY